MPKEKQGEAKTQITCAGIEPATSLLPLTALSIEVETVLAGEERGGV